MRRVACGLPRDLDGPGVAREDQASRPVFCVVGADGLRRQRLQPSVMMRVGAFWPRAPQCGRAFAGGAFRHLVSSAPERSRFSFQVFRVSCQ